MARVHAARFLVVEPDCVLEDCGVLVVGGRIARVLPSPASVARAVRAGARLAPGSVDRDGVLTPGLVDAHAHLDLSGLAGRVAPGRDFPAWIEGLLRARATRTEAQRERDAEAGARALIATGTTCVGDVDSSGASARGLARTGIRAVVYREVLDPLGEDQRAEACARIARAPRPRKRLREGLSPHSPLTCSRALLSHAARMARARRLPVAVHWAETEEEGRFMTRGDGPFARLLREHPGRPGLEELARAGLLGRRTTLVHANHPARGEVARAAGVAGIVHCPGAHRFFGRQPFSPDRWLRAGANLALGTDSLAGNDALDMRREMALLRAAHGALTPAAVLGMATTGAARALSLGREVGRLSPGYAADLVLHGPAPRRRAEVLEALTLGLLFVRAVFIGGRRAAGAKSPPFDRTESSLD